MGEDAARELLLQVAEREPGIILDIMAAGQRLEPEVDPRAPDRDELFWCICGNCIEMPTDAERICCRHDAHNCLSRHPVCN